jgi:phosphonate transport system substrate-binding protein
MRYVFLFLFVLSSAVLQAQTIRLATYQYADNPRIKNITPFAEHLRSKYGFDVSVKSYPTVHSFIEAIQNNEVDVALINTFGYLLLETSSKKYPMYPALTLKVNEDAKDNYKTAFVMHKSKCKQFSEISASASSLRFALVAKGSTSGNLVPRLALAGQNINDAETNFKTVYYAGTHKAALDAVLKDSADISAFGHTELEKLQSSDVSAYSKLCVVWMSPEIPLGPVLINTNLSSSISNRIEKAFLLLEKENTPALNDIKSAWTEAKQAGGYIRINKSFYDSFAKRFGTRASLNNILLRFAN